MNNTWIAFQERFADYSPTLLSSIALLLVGLIVAWIAANLAKRFVRRSRLHGALDRSPSVRQTGNPEQLSKIVWMLVFFVVLLFFLVPFFDVLDLGQITTPLNEFLVRIFGYLPRLISAGLLLALAWVVATALKLVISTAVREARLDDRLQHAAPEAGTQSLPLSGLLGNAAFYLVILFFLPAVLDALALPGVLVPVQNMVNEILSVLPNLLAAAVLLAVAYVVAYIVKALVQNGLAALGLNAFLHRMGITAAVTGQTSPSAVIGWIAFFAIMLTASIEAARLAGFTVFAAMLAGFMTLAGQVLLGVVIFLLGLTLAQFAARAIRGSGIQNSSMAAMFAQGAILILSGAMALRQMGIADDIVNLAFGLTLGGIAVAFAVAFGLGGQDVARDLLRKGEASLQAGKQGGQRGM